MLTGFEESDTKTVLRFYRKFDTCDPRDRAIKVPVYKILALKECVILVIQSSSFFLTARYHQGGVRLSHGGPSV